MFTKILRVARLNRDQRYGELGSCSVTAHAESVSSACEGAGSIVGVLIGLLRSLPRQPLPRYLPCFKASCS